ncbi:hypothetical protein EC957_007920 [Mortierella hygrophila]|uniref:Uncharacterized protein n=1 Tax=Mortierella hygrophila TaxID=979708 RepID=A0A9P6K648_9FUNG|nr:hypothetical protein EC957_007920 [Mortierella hygrophila]
MATKFRCKLYQVLDLPAFLLDLLHLLAIKDILVLKTTDPSSNYTVGIHDNGVQPLELEAGLADVSRVLSTAKSDSDLESIAITDLNLELAGKDKIKSTCFDTLSKATLHQAVLVGSLLNNEAGTVVLNMLESMGRVHVVIFQDELDMETWIAQILKSLTSSSSLTALDQIEDLRKIFPGHDKTSLGRQAIQALNAFHLEVIAELIKASNQDVQQDRLWKEHLTASTHDFGYVSPQ